METQMGRKKKQEEPTAEVSLVISKDKIEKVVPSEEPGGEPTLVQVHPPLPTENPDAEPPKPKRGRKKKDAPNVATLTDLAAAYAVQMESDGKSNGTIASYGMELKLAQDELGADTLLSDLTPERVGEFFTCKRVTKLRSGKAKSQLSIDKTRRVLRLALVWAEERGIIARAPIPEVEAK